MMDLPMIDDRVQQTPATAFWKFELSPSFQPSPNMNYICVPTTVEFKKRIISLIQNLSFLSWVSVLAQYWAAKETGNSVVLTTTTQPYGIWGENKDLESYHKGCSDHKLYIHPKEEVAFGLSGRAFLNRSPEQTQNAHDYPEDQRPPCDDAIFNKTMGSFAVPVIENGDCLGVLEFVLDTRKASYDDDIGVVCSALQHAGFQSSFRTDLPIKTYITPRKRSRTTSSSEFTRYCRLVPYFGLSSADAAFKLQETSVKPSEPITPGTFRNACRNVGIHEWPWISKRKSTTASSDDTETHTNLIASETSSFATLIASDYMPNWNKRISKRPCKRTLTTDQVPLSKYLINQKGCEASSSGTKMGTAYGSLGFPANSEFMASNTRSFGAPFAAEYSSFGPPFANEYSSSRAPIATEYGSFGLRANSEFMASSTSSFGAPFAAEYSSFGPPYVNEYSSSRAPIAMEYGSFGLPANSEFMASNTSSFGAPIATEYSCSGAPAETEYNACETSSVGSVTATNHMSGLSSSSIPIWDGGNSELAYTQSTTTTNASHDASSFATTYPTEYVESDATSFQTPVATEYKSFGTPTATEDIGFLDCISLEDLINGASPLETLNNQSASGASCIEPLVESQPAPDDFMQDSNELKDLDLQDKFADMLFDFDEWDRTQNLPDYI